MINTNLLIKWNFLQHNNELEIELDDSRFLNKEDVDNLIKSHAIKIARFFGKDKDDLLEALTKYNDKVLNNYIPGLNADFSYEMIFNFIDFKNGKLKLGLTSGLMAKALQKGYKDEKQKPIVVQGVLITKDNKLVMGVRAKPDFRYDLPNEPFDYRIMFSPAGYGKYNKEGDLYKSFYSELNEELGMTKENITEMRIFGQHEDTGFTDGIRITFKVYSNLTFDEIVKKWENASHNWEYEQLIGIENHKDAINRLLTTDDFSNYSKSAKGLLKQSVEPIFEKLL